MIALISVAVLIAACGNEHKLNQIDIEKKMVNQGELAPMFDLKDLNGNKVALADLAGEKVYVKYWASWCSICLAGLDELDTLAAQKSDFKVISVVSPNL